MGYQGVCYDIWLTSYRAEDELGFMLSSTSPENAPVVGEQVVPALSEEVDKENAAVSIAEGTHVVKPPQMPVEQTQSVKKSTKLIAGPKKQIYSRAVRPELELVSQAMKVTMGEEKLANKSKRARRHSRWAMKKRIMRELEARDGGASLEA